MPAKKQQKTLPSLKVVRDQVVAEERIRYTESFEAFFKAAWTTLEPNVEFDDSPHYQLLFEYAQLLGSGEFKKRFPDKDGLIVCIPPRSLKTLCFSVAMPVWVWLREPHKRFLCLSYGSDLATAFSIKRRDLIRSKFVKSHWPELKIKEDSDTKGKYDNTMGGYMIAGSPGAMATGYGGDIIICDDLLKAEEAFSKASRESANRFFDNTLTSRRNNPATGTFLAVQQRLHENDLVGHLLKQNPDRWIVVEIPLEAEETKTYMMPITGTKWLRKKGNVLLPKRFTKAFRDDLKHKPRVLSGQYQQHPSPPGGFIFEPDRWGSSAGKACYYDNLPEFEFTILSIDCAWKSADENDFTAMWVIGVKGNKRWLVDFRTERMNYIQQCDNIRELRKLYPNISYVLIEEAANGYAVIKQMNEEMTGVIPIKPEGGKESRAVAASADMPYFFLPDPSKDPRIQPVIDNFAHFAGEGTVDHDDDIDAFSQAVNWLRMRFWGVDHVDKAYAEATKGKTSLEAAPEGEKQKCPVCTKETITVTASGWKCSSCTSFVDGARKRIIKAGM